MADAVLITSMIFCSPSLPSESLKGDKLICTLFNSFGLRSRRARPHRVPFILDIHSELGTLTQKITLDIQSELGTLTQRRTLAKTKRSPKETTSGPNKKGSRKEKC